MKPARFATVADATWTCELLELEIDRLRAREKRLVEAGAEMLTVCKCHTQCEVCNAMRAAIAGLAES